MISITDMPEATQLNADIAISIFSDFISERDQNRAYYQRIISDQADEIERLAERLAAEICTNKQLNERLAPNDECSGCAELKKQLEKAQASESETDTIHHIQVTKFANFFDWMQKLMENKSIPAACKLVLMQIYLSFYFMRSSITNEEMRVGIEETARKTGMSTSTVRKACDKFQEHDVLKRRYEPIVSERGDKTTLVHFTLNEIALAPQDIEMENNHGGKREKRCPNPTCQSNNVDRYTVQYCRECDENDWYLQPGTREDAPYEKAQKAKNRTPYGKGKKQDAFEPDAANLSSQIDRAIGKHEAKLETIHSTQAEQASKKQDAFADIDSQPIPEYAPGTLLRDVVNQLDEAIASAQAQPKKQDAFVGQSASSSPAPQLEAEHTTYVTQQVAKAPTVAVCKAIWSLNASGKPANAKLHEKVVSTRECGSKRWQWQESEKSYVCSDCWTPLPMPTL